MAKKFELKERGTGQTIYPVTNIDSVLGLKEKLNTVGGGSALPVSAVDVVVDSTNNVITLNPYTKVLINEAVQEVILKPIADNYSCDLYVTYSGGYGHVTVNISSQAPYTVSVEKGDDSTTLNMGLGGGCTHYKCNIKNNIITVISTSMDNETMPFIYPCMVATQDWGRPFLVNPLAYNFDGYNGNYLGYINIKNLKDLPIDEDGTTKALNIALMNIPLLLGPSGDLISSMIYYPIKFLLTNDSNVEVAFRFKKGSSGGQFKDTMNEMFGPNYKMFVPANCTYMIDALVIGEQGPTEQSPSWELTILNGTTQTFPKIEYLN